MLSWCKQFSILCFFDSNGYSSSYAGYDCLLAVGARAHIRGESGDLLSGLQAFHDQHEDWMFGNLCYDYKNVLEPKLGSAQPQKHHFPLLNFFIPQTVCYINRERTVLTIASYDNPCYVYEQITDACVLEGLLPELSFTSEQNKETYLRTINDLREHIAAGDCYEINYCNQGYCEAADIDPFLVFQSLNRLSPAPFAAFYRLQDEYMMCASPERYMRKDGTTLISQPIKGTAKRGADKHEDDELKKLLAESIKERAENVMIVDLVRNDIAKSCETGSVQVSELFGIYTYPQVHQMISTVTGVLKPTLSFTDAIRYSFPMGSMTGAPKYKVMELIERYEPSRRELFSGSVGYITPGGDFDFNVVIRSLFYNQVDRYLSYQTGGAITYDSVPEQEWEEMRLKAWALERIFRDKTTAQKQ